MVAEGRARPAESRGFLGRLIRGALVLLWPTQRLVATREGLCSVVVLGFVLVLGSNQHVNLFHLVARLSAGAVSERAYGEWVWRRQWCLLHAAESLRGQRKDGIAKPQVFHGMGA